MKGVTAPREFRRRLPLLLFAVVAALLALSWSARTKSPLDRFRERIGIGSTRAEVEDALGGPPGDYRAVEHLPSLSRSQAVPYSGFADWLFDGWLIRIVFDEQNRVSCFEEHKLHRTPRQFWWERIF